MKRKVASVFIIFLIVFSVSLKFGFDPVKMNVKASNGYPVHNLNTGLNYSTIQSAINAIQTLDGHTILVDTGIFYENIHVTKALTIISYSENTTIDGGVELEARYAKINGFIINLGVTISRWYCEIQNNVILGGSPFGVQLSYMKYCNITLNRLNGTESTGIMLSLDGNDYNRIEGNSISHCYAGITIQGDYNIIQGNNVTNCTSFGMFLAGNHNNITYNVFSDNEDGFICSDTSTSNWIYLNDFFNNTRNVLAVLEPNSWDNGSYGNYWDDYNGTDENSDGIGETPYEINNFNQDNYPLIEQVIPEFPSMVLLSLLMTIALLGAVVSKRKIR